MYILGFGLGHPGMYCASDRVGVLCGRLLNVTQSGTVVRQEVREFIKPFVPAPIRLRVRRIVGRMRSTPTRPVLPPMQRADAHLESLQYARRRTLGRSGVTRFSLRPVHRFFNVIGVPAQALPGEWWSHLLFERASIQAYSANGDPKFIECTKALDPQLMGALEWLEVYLLLLRVGLYHSANVVRDHARTRALSVDITQCTPTEGKLYLAAALELRQYEKVEDACLALEEEGAETELVATSRFLMALYQGAVGSAVPRTDEDLLYREYVASRSVAVVGPAPAGACSADEIDSHDRVVRLNFGESGKGCDPCSRGLRSDVTYFNHEFARRLFEAGMPIPEELKWVVFRGPSWKTKYSAAFGRAHVTARGFDVSPNMCLFNGDFNAIPNVVLDLLRFDSYSVKVFHADLMLTVQRFAGYHWWADCSFDQGVDEQIRLIENYLRSFVFHDPVTQYVLLSNLWEAGRVVGDERFTEVMRLGCEEYMRQMQTVYGEPFNAYLWRKVADER